MAFFVFENSQKHSLNKPRENNNTMSKSGAETITDVLKTVK
jgi:hypothetical protein